MWWVLPCSAALSGTDQPSARGRASLDPWAQTGLRLVVAYAARLQVAGKGGSPEGGGGKPRLRAAPPPTPSMIMLCCTSTGTIGAYSTVHYQILCTALCLVGTRKSGLMLYHLPWIARNFHIHRVISLSPVSRGYIRPSRHQIRLQKQKNEPWLTTVWHSLHSLHSWHFSSHRASDSPSSETTPRGQ